MLGFLILRLKGYIMETLDRDQAIAYSRSEFQNTYYLGYRDIPDILKMFCQKGEALDYGCGTGRSTRFLNQLGFSSVGVDISNDMLLKAQELDPNGIYRHIQSGKIPYPDHSFDLVFSCFVFLTVPTYSELKEIFSEIERVLKPGGTFVFVTGSKYLYHKKYISYDIAPRMDLSTEEEIEVCLKDLGVVFKNYFYSDKDYRSLIDKAGLRLVQYHEPLGLDIDGVRWENETLFGPYLIYTAKK